jgi:hypothetical protein
MMIYESTLRMILTFRRHFYQECLNLCVCVCEKRLLISIYIVENEITLEILKHLVIRCVCQRSSEKNHIVELSKNYPN